MRDNKIFFVIFMLAMLGFISYFLINNESKESIREAEDSGDVSQEDKSQDTQKGSVVSNTSTSKQNPPKATFVPDSSFPEIDFINQMISFNLVGFDRVKLTIEKVVFGRGDAAKSTGCQGIPNANFDTYLYPGSGICINEGEVDGSPRGIIAFHVLVENNGNSGFGGNSDILKLHYLRAGSGGEVNHRFAYPVSGLASYYINGYSSRQIILSYLVPEDQLVYDFLVNYKEPALEDRTLNVYNNSSQGLLVDFSNKVVKLVK